MRYVGQIQFSQEKENHSKQMKKSTRQPYGGEKWHFWRSQRSWNIVTAWHEGQRGKQSHIVHSLIVSLLKGLEI